VRTPSFSSLSSFEEPQKKKKAPKGNGKMTDAKRKSTNASLLLKRKGKGRAIPKRVEDSDAADLMVWQWRHAGRTWPEIRAEWTRMTGQVPGRSSLSVRMAKMQDNFIDNGGADVSAIIL
jgi:hypothetical protein